jgi:Rrf2 family protein
MLSITGEYAHRAMVYLAKNAERWPISGPRIAEAAGVPRKYLSAILANLVRAGLLEGARGKRGGFRITHPAQRIRLADVVAPYEPVNSQRRTCPFGNAVCSDTNPCGAHEQWKSVKAVYDRFFGANDPAGCGHNTRGSKRDVKRSGRQLWLSLANTRTSTQGPFRFV